MIRRTWAKVIALGLCGVLGVLLVPGCSELGLGGEGGGGGASPDEALAEVDPMEVSRAQIEAGYTIYLIESMIQDNVADPSTVDDDTLQAMADQYAPDAAAAAKDFVQGLDTATIPLFSPDPDKMASCIDKFGCEPLEACPFSKACWLVDCGDARCSKCPTNFQPSKLLFTGWCAHVCVGGTPPSVVGYKAVIHLRGGRRYNYCYNIANDH